MLATDTTDQKGRQMNGASILAALGLALAVIAVAIVIDAVCNLLRAIAEHRRAQATSVLHHAGLLIDDRGDE